MTPAKTVVIISERFVWEQAKTRGEYTQSTLDTTLAEVGFIHCSFPNQTLEILNRKFTSPRDLVLLLIDPAQVTAEVKYEAALSGRLGTFPHIYGPLNIDAVYAIVSLDQGADGKFLMPTELQNEQPVEGN